MAKRHKRYFGFFFFKVFALVLALAAVLPAIECSALPSAPEKTASGKSPNSFLMENEPLSYVLMQRAANDPAHSGSLLGQALNASPDLPPVYFSMAAQNLRDFSSGPRGFPERLFSWFYYCVEGFKAYGRNWWWAMDLSGLLVLSLVWSFFISVTVTAVLRLPKEFPLLKHDINEQRRHLFLFLIPAAGAFFGPVFFLASVFLLLGLYFPRRDRVLVYFVMLFFAFVPSLTGWAESVYHAATPAMRAVVAINEDTDNSPALQALDGRRDFETLFSYGLASSRAGKLSEAIAAYSAAIDKKKDPRAYVNLGNCYFLLGEPDKAGEFYRTSIGIKPGAAAYFNLAQMSRDELDYAKGDEFYRQATSIDPARVARFMGMEGESKNAPGEKLLTDESPGGKLLMDETLDMHDFYGMFEKAGRDAAASSEGLYPGLLAPAAALWIVFFFFYGKSGGVKAFRCSRCGKILCERCERQLYWGRMCSECYRSLVKIEVLDPKERVARLLKIHGGQLKRNALVRALGFAPPGIAYIYGGNILQGMLLLWGFIFFLLAALLNPLFTVGLSAMGHVWLNAAAAIGVGLLYTLSFAGIRGRQGREWL